MAGDLKSYAAHHAGLKFGEYIHNAYHVHLQTNPQYSRIEQRKTNGISLSLFAHYRYYESFCLAFMFSACGALDRPNFLC